MDITKHTKIELHISSPYTQEQIEQKLIEVLINNGMLIKPLGDKSIEVKFFPVIVDDIQC